MVQIVKHGTRFTDCCAGVKFTCGQCECEFILGRNDKMPTHGPRYVPGGGFMGYGWAVECPECGYSVNTPENTHHGF